MYLYIWVHVCKHAFQYLNTNAFSYVTPTDFMKSGLCWNIRSYSEIFEEMFRGLRHVNPYFNVINYMTNINTLQHNLPIAR